MSRFQKLMKRQINAGRREICKSIESSVSFSVTFRNLLEEPVRLYWIDFNGDAKFYGLIRSSAVHDDGLTITTFVTHPWLAIDHATGKFLHVNFQRIFRPVSRQDFLEEKMRVNRIRMCPLTDSLERLNGDVTQESPESGSHIDAFITETVFKLELCCCLKICKMIPKDKLESLPMPRSIIETLLKIYDHWILSSEDS